MARGALWWRAQPLLAWRVELGGVELGRCSNGAVLEVVSSATCADPCTRTFSSKCCERRGPRSTIPHLYNVLVSENPNINVSFHRTVADTFLKYRVIHTSTSIPHTALI